MQVAIASINIKWRDKTHNLKKCTSLIKRASSKGSDLIIFPEMTLTGFAVNNPLSECYKKSWTIKQFSNLAKRYKISIFFGVSIFANEKKSFNSMICVDRDGKILSRYNKINLFSHANEDLLFSAGQRPEITSFNEFKIGNSICFDLRFPELFRQYANSCQILLNIANWPSKRARDWSSLLKARAIENQCIMIGVNRQGVDDKNQIFKKSSFIYTHDGKKLSPFFESKELDLYQLDLEKVYKYRLRFPFTQDIKSSSFLNMKI